MPVCLFGQNLIPGNLQGVETTGIQWTSGLSWQKIIEKAKKENKYIFVDCFATWCIPCKKMDAVVYPDEAVGKFMNERFISVKAQMDRTPLDDSVVKRWYTDAQMLNERYAINSFPSFLYFYPDGLPMHKAVGYLSSINFVAEAYKALNPNQQYYRVLREYKPGVFDTSELKGLARAYKFSGKELAWKIADDYLGRIPKSALSSPDNIKFMIEFNESPNVLAYAAAYLSGLSKNQLTSSNNLYFIGVFKKSFEVQNLVLGYLKRLTNLELKKEINQKLLLLFKNVPNAKPIANKYLKSLGEQELYTADNLNLLIQYTKSPKDWGFSIFYDTARVKRVEAAMKIKYPNFHASDVAKTIFISSELDRFYKQAVQEQSVDWDSVSNYFKQKYSKEFVDESILKTRVFALNELTKKNKYYRSEYIEYNILLIERYGTDTTSTFADATQINNFVFEQIFMHSKDLNQLLVALNWMEGVIRRNPNDANNIDTYSNLLYKIGRKDDAIHWQEKALKLARSLNQTWFIAPIEKNLQKMKEGMPTWATE